MAESAPATVPAAVAAPAAPAAAATTPAVVAQPAAPAAPAAPPAVPPALAAMLPAEPSKLVEAPKPAEAPKADAKSTEAQVAELRAQLASTRMRDAVVAAATEAGAIAPEQVLKLLADELDVAPDGRVFVKGQPTLDARAHVARYLASNLHLLKPSVPGGGAGSPSTAQPAQPSIAGDPSTAQGGTQAVRGFLGRIFAPTAPANGGAAAPR